MPESTAKFIAYDMRPAKQTERRGIVEFLASARSAGFDIPSYRYVGFGGTKFIDFLLMNKHVGFAEYHSLEHDESLFDRCAFNRPFEGISMHAGGVSDFLGPGGFAGNSVFWFDYEMSLGEELLTDLNSVALNAKDGDFVFVSVSGEVPSAVDRSKDKNGVLKSRLPGFKSYIDKLKPDAFTRSTFPHTVGKLLLLMMQSAFSVRFSEGRFSPRFKVVYKDSSWMVTVGGVFAQVKSRRVSRLNRELAKGLQMMCPKAIYAFYTIPVFNFTQLERILLDKSCVVDGSGYTRRLRRLGIAESHLQEYERLARFVPKFSEVTI